MNTAEQVSEQWQATHDGMVGRTLTGSPYFIGARRLLQIRLVDERTLYEWPLHVAQKSWIDLDSFERAFRSAIQRHAGRIGSTVDERMVDESFRRARQIQASRNRGRDL